MRANTCDHPQPSGQQRVLILSHLPEGVSHHGYPHLLRVLLAGTCETTGLRGGSGGLGTGTPLQALCRAEFSILGDAFWKEEVDGHPSLSSWEV